MQILCAVLLLIIIGLLIALRLAIKKIKFLETKIQEAAALLNIAGEQFIKIAEVMKEAPNNTEEETK